MSRRLIAVSMAAAVLAGCGTTPEERGVSGAGVGAGTGALIGAITGLTVLQGAALGAIGGALTGALTKPDQVNLGQPAWKQGQAQAATSAPVASAAMTTTPVADIQRGLIRLGYDCGVADGVYGPKTRDAIRKYQADHNLLVDGRATGELAAHINAQG